MPPENPFLFTYGTLKKSFENPFSERLRNAAEYVSEGFFYGKMYRISWYPGAVAEPHSDTKVFGEIYRIHSPDIWRNLDDYEDVMDDESASLYLRRIVPVNTQTHGIMACWTYVYNQSLDGLELVPGGIFTG